jgi:hypothetical protein
MKNVTEVKDVNTEAVNELAAFAAAANQNLRSEFAGQLLTCKKGRWSYGKDKTELALEEARQRGLLQAFNQKYAALRRQARRQGVGFMAYSVAVHRLRSELMRAVAGDVRADMIDRALGVSSNNSAAADGG